MRYAVGPAGLTGFVAVEKEVGGVFFCYTMRRQCFQMRRRSSRESCEK
jgi:hypothetical protein